MVELELTVPARLVISRAVVVTVPLARVGAMTIAELSVIEVSDWIELTLY